jgi:hypothetical protein
MAEMAQLSRCDGVMDRIALCFCSSSGCAGSGDNSRQMMGGGLKAAQVEGRKVDGGIDLRNGKTSVTA